MPTFQGGDLLAFQSWVHERLRAQDGGVSGVVVVSFIVETDGSLSDINILNSPDQSLTNEATRVLKLAPKWQPGKHYGDVVRVKYTMPIRFTIP
jgi:protein TonB